MSDHQRHLWVTDRCSTGKRAYPERAHAKAAVKFMAKTGNGGVHAYRCPGCDFWHVGHPPRALVEGRATAEEWYGA